MTGASGPGGTSSYVYDAFRRRVAETTNGSTIRFLHDGVGLGTTILAEYGVPAQLVTGYALTPFVDGRLARSGGGAVHYYLPDGLGSTRLLVDESGAAANRYEYDAFGQTVQRRRRGQRLPVQRRRWDDVAALYDNRSRRYDPALGRFVQADPLGQIEQANLYQYARNNPATRIDPLGWSSTDCLTVNKKSDDLLGLKQHTDRLNSLMSSLPSRPTIKAGSTLSVQGS
ncbi:MAG: RHS repeat-associated core domain-containing protein [Caldilineaceae bacterium]